MKEQTIFQFEEGAITFEDLRRENGDSFWYASTLMENLGYDNPRSFTRPINRAMVACNALNIPISEVFREEKRVISGREVIDYRLSRFGCYLVAMNADVRKPEVARAQAYFITMAEAFRQYVQEAEHVGRLAIREELSEHELSISEVAHQGGVENYALFKNAGYRGLYNMNLKDLKSYKKMPGDRSKSLLHYMGKVELAANLFRLTQTEEKIKNERIMGQRPLEIAAESVGKQVRETMIKIGSRKPENLPLTKPIDEVKKNLRVAGKKFKELDKPK